MPKLRVLPDFGTPGVQKTAVIEVGYEDYDSPTAGDASGVTIPANSLVSFRPVVTEAFDAGTTNVITFGYLGALTAYVGAGDLDETSATVQTALGPFHVTDETEVYLHAAQTGTAATAGRLLMLVEITPLA